MGTPRSTYLKAAGHEIHVTEWGDPGRSALVMWHGLARTGRDFDEAAEALSASYFVLCPDTLGRGLSAWAREEDYAFPVYMATVLGLLDHYRIDRLRWIGTSMGGMLGMVLAAGPLKQRMTHLVLNDIGPELPTEAATRIGTYVGNPPVFDTMAQMEAWLRESYRPFGRNTDTFWRRMADTSVRPTDDGRLTVHYDPAIAASFGRPHTDAWPVYDGVTARTLLLRGADSDVLPRPVAKRMTGRGPKPRLHEFAGVGHAPTLASEAEIALLGDFLAG